MVPLCAVSGEKERVVCRAATAEGLFIPRLQWVEDQSVRVEFWRGDLRIHFSEED